MDAVELAGFVPYRMQQETADFFLQMRDAHAPTHPNMFSLFGGSLEAGETSLQGVLREIHEELTYVPARMEKLPQTFRGQHNDKLFDVYIEEVGADFESRVTVMEGEYGRFLSGPEIAARTDVSDLAKEVIGAIEGHLAQKKD